MGDDAAKFAQYDVLEPIGKGSYGVVSRIRRKSDGKILVWKEMDYGKMSDKEKQLLVAEVNILRELRSPYVVKYHDRILDRDNTKLYIVMEYCEGGDLANCIRKHRRDGAYFEEEVIWRVLTQLIWAINDCHNHPKGKILHRDIKPANIFIDPKRSDIKIGDFGLARVLGDKTQFVTTNVGTPYYMSPEQINDEAYNHKCDVWSIGCTIYELAALRPPFEAQTHIALAMKIRQGQFPRIPAMYSNELHSLIARMLTLRSSERISIAQILQDRHVALRTRELKVQSHYRVLRQKEEEIAQRESALKERENALRERERKAAVLVKQSDVGGFAMPPSRVAHENAQPNVM